MISQEVKTFPFHGNYVGSIPTSHLLGALIYAGLVLAVSTTAFQAVSEGSNPLSRSSPKGQIQMKLKPLGLFANRTQQASLCMETHRITSVSAVN